MRQRAHDYHSMMAGMLHNLGPDAVALGLQEFRPWDLMHFKVSTSTAVSTLAEWFGLDAPTIERAGTIVWPQATGEEGHLRVVVTGPHGLESGSGGTAGPCCGGHGRGGGRPEDRCRAAEWLASAMGRRFTRDRRAPGGR